MKNNTISALIQQGRAYNSSSFLLRFGKRDDFKDVEVVRSAGKSIKTVKMSKNIAFLAPKKTFPTAVVRNKVKRRLRAVFTAGFRNNPIHKDILIVCTGKKSVLDMDFKDLQEEVRSSLIALRKIS